MILKTISTGSSGNCYLLTADSGETLILDAGVPVKDIKKGLGWNIRDVVGCIVTHEHKDHSRSVKDLRDMGIKVFAPYRSLDDINADESTMLGQIFGGFRITAFQVPHNGTRNCGFLVQTEGQKFLYMTDLEYCPYTFKKQHINHMLIECNYIKDMIDTDLPNFTHKVKGHCELQTTKEIVEANRSDDLANVILCHMGAGTCNKERIILEIQKIVPQVNLDVAEAGKEFILRKADECPF